MPIISPHNFGSTSAQAPQDRFTKGPKRDAFPPPLSEDLRKSLEKARLENINPSKNADIDRLLKWAKEEGEKREKLNTMPRPNPPLSAADRSRMSAASQALWREIRELRRAGYEVVPELSCTEITDSNPFFCLLGSKTDKVDFKIARTPAEYVAFHHPMDKEIPPVLSESSGVIKVPIYSLESIKLNSQWGLIRLYDNLNPSHPLVSQRAFSISVPIDRYRAEDEIREELKASFRKQSPAYDREIERMGGATGPKPKWSAELLHGEKIPTATRANIEKLLKRDGHLTLGLLPRDKEVDRYVELKGIHRATALGLDIDAKRFQRISQPLLINGGISVITFRIPLTKEGRPATNAGKHTSKPIDYIDSYGNTIISHIREGDGPPVRLLSVMPRRFALSEQGDATPQPLNIDLRRLGYGKIEGFVYRTPELPLCKAGPYTVYSNMDGPTALKSYAKYFDLLASNIGDIEQLFDFKPGEKVKNIQIVRSKNPNAIVDIKDPHTIEVWDAALKDELQKKILIRHETLHAMHFVRHPEREDKILYACWKEFRGDDRVKVSPLLQQSLTQSVTGIPRAMRPGIAFLHSLNESYFYEGIRKENKGHASDNCNEFFASLTNSLRHPHWEERINALSVEFKTLGLGDYKQKYLKALEALQAQLQATHDISPYAPILQVIQEKIDYLRLGW